MAEGPDRRRCFQIEGFGFEEVVKLVDHKIAGEVEPAATAFDLGNRDIRMVGFGFLWSQRENKEHGRILWRPNNNAGGTCLAPAFLAGIGLTSPEIPITNDVAGLKHEVSHRQE